MATGNRGGRPRKIVALSTRKISKQEKLERMRQEKNIRLDRDELMEAPEWLSEVAKEEFYRVVREAGKIPLLDNLDKNYLAIYADAFDRYVNASRKLQEHGDVVSTEKNGLAVSPWLNVLTKAAKEMKDASKLLGLATTDRLRLIVPKVEEKPENKFLKYLNR